MLSVVLGGNRQPLRKVLCLGAHCDDIEIGCGGTILRLLEENRELEFYWLVFSSTPQRKREAEKAAKLFLKSAGHKIAIKSFRDGYFPHEGAKIKDAFEALKKTFSPDLIFTHYRADLHQDHRLICELTWNTFRNHLILEYEIPKYDGDLGAPNFFVSLREPLCAQKAEYILAAFESQRNKHWLTEDTLRAILRIRGVESNSPEKFAEAFYCRKLVLQSKGAL